MYYVYVLRDDFGKTYKGMTANINQRLLEHKRGYTKSTRHLKNPMVVYSEEFPNRASARQREKYLKSAAGRKFLKGKIQ
jgi:putative endonuclease